MALAVGSGGDGLPGSSNGRRGGGGGSGYVAFSVEFPTKPYFEMFVIAPSEFGDYYVKEIETNRTIVVGRRGNDAFNEDGGAGL